MRGTLDTHEDPAEIPLKEMHPGPKAHATGQSHASNLATPETAGATAAVSWSAGAGQQATAASATAGAMS